MSAPIDTHPYEPFIPGMTHTLVLGSIPPHRFCAKQELRTHDVDFYYGSQDNAFWRLVGEASGRLFVRTPGSEGVEQRKQYLQDNRLGMADVVLRCLRRKQGSSDSDLSEIIFRDIATLFKEHQEIRRILYTSGFVRNCLSRILGIQQKRDAKDPHYGWFEFENRHFQTTTLFSPSPLALRGLGPNGTTRRKEQYSKIFSLSQ